MKHTYLIWGLGFTFSFLLLLQACVHEPILPALPQPNDTVSTPDDSTTNPSDTTSLVHPCDPDTVYFSRDLLPILQSNCAKSGCHDAASAQDGVILDSYANVVNTGDVRPGNTGGSDLYEVLTDTDPDKRMPPPPNDPLSAELISMVAIWINQGAKDLSCEESAACDTTSVTYAGTVAPILQTYCTGCHGATDPSADISLVSHSGVAAMANNGRLYGAISHQVGFKPMPQNGNQLPACEIAQIRVWIDEGAANN